MPKGLHNTSVISASVLAFATIAHAPAFAAEGVADTAQTAPAGRPADAPIGIGDIVVTANKRAQSIKDVGLTITAISPTALQQQNVTSLQDLAKAVPGLSYVQTESSTPVYSLRGVGFYETSLAAYPDVSVYLDEVPLPFPTLTTLTLFDLDRVEVLKGPQGTVFGNNATGGAINYIAAKPTDTFHAGGSLSYGRFNTFAGEGYASGPITDTLKTRVAISTKQGDGWQYSLTRPSDHNGAPNTLAVRWLTTWHPTDRFHVQLNLNGWRDRTQPTQAQFLHFNALYPGVPAPDASQQISPNKSRVADWPTDYPPRANNRFLQAALRAEYDLTDTISLTSISSYIDYKHDQTPDGDGNSVHRTDLIINQGFIKNFSQELRLSNGSHRGFRWLLGANYSNDHVLEDDFVDYADATASPVFGGAIGNGLSSDQHMKNYAVFGNTELDLGQFTLKGGARYTQADRRTSSCVFSRDDQYDGPVPTAAIIAAFSSLISGSPTPVPGPFQCFELNSDAAPGSPNYFKPGEYNAKLNQHNVSWRGGVDWKPSRTFLAYMNVAKGYKAGSFPTISGSTFKALHPVTQESVVDYEGGIKTQLFDNKLSIDAAAFYYDYKNKQLKGKYLDPFFGPLDALVNIPKSSVTGGEITIDARPVRGLDLSVNGTYLDAKIKQFVGINSAGQSGDFAGTRMPYTPKWQIGANANYEFPVSERFNAFLGGQVNYRSKTNSAIGGSAEYTLPAYTLLDVQAGIEAAGGQWKAFLWGKNVTNKFYILNVLEYTDGRDRFVGMPATYGVTIAFKY